ncbi:hypothetical protein [Deinococcus hopiensis]|uniref:hypothetical protein n=1 Tax=Deinococcus hopiensis TaxID=309885 RepID=UPI0014831D77|nr:hypothetical protein [Deinococcus hopiensis]
MAHQVEFQRRELAVVEQRGPLDSEDRRFLRRAALQLLGKVGHRHVGFSHLHHPL